MKAFKDRLPSGRVIGTAGVLIGALSIVLSLGGLSLAGKRGFKVVTRTASVLPQQGQADNNERWELATVSKSCKAGETALSGNAYWSGASPTNTDPTPPDQTNDELLLIDVHRTSKRAYTARGAADLNGATLNLQVVCKKP